MLQTLITLHLIEKFKLHGCLLNEEDSWNFQYPGETDRKLSDVFLEDLAMEVYHGGCSYLEAKLWLNNWLMECSFDKDIVLLKKLLNQFYIPVVKYKTHDSSTNEHPKCGYFQLCIIPYIPYIAIAIAPDT